MSEGVVKRAWAAQIWWSTYVKDACVATCVAKAVSEGLGVVLVPVKCRYVARVRVVAWVLGKKVHSPMIWDPTRAFPSTLSSFSWSFVGAEWAKAKGVPGDALHPPKRTQMTSYHPACIGRRCAGCAGSGPTRS